MILKKWFSDRLKRMEDLSLTVATSPVTVPMLAAAATTKVIEGESPSPSVERCRGRGGKEFKRRFWCAPKSPRRLQGAVEWLKRFRAYELPSLYNILKGEMSWVGPEPLASYEGLDSNQIAPREARERVRPGWVDPYRLRKKMKIPNLDRRRLESQHLATRSLVNDLSLLVRSFPAYLLGSEAPVDSDAFELLGIRVANLDTRGALDRLEELADEGEAHVYFANPHCFNISRRDAFYRRILEQSDMVLPDGVGIKIAAKMIGAELKENLNGTDLFPRLCERCEETGRTLYLVGARPGVAEEVARRMTEKFPGLEIAGVHDGYFDEGSPEEEALLDHIRTSKPDFLLVARGVPTQEKWIEKHREGMGVGVAMGVGGLFDFYSGRIQRAPLWVRELGLEWFWRFLQEPRRMFSRYFIGNPVFLAHVWHWSSNLAQSALLDRYSELMRPYARFQAEASMGLRRMAWWTATQGTAKLKRLFDIAASGAGILALSPLLLGTAAAIKIEDPDGPVFFVQKRVGRRGRPFDMLKFRSMVSNAEELKKELEAQNESEDGVIFKIKDDPRITKVGKIIRKYSVDELPQLFNILKGDMAVVGPRPPIPSEVAQYRVGDRYRLEVTPGLTCVWQVSGRSELSFNQQVELDQGYIRRIGFWEDIKLIAKTVPVVLTGEGAY